MINPFTFDWDAPIDETEKDRLLLRMADVVVGRGLQMPVSWLLEIHRPVMNIASQFSITFSPFIASLFPGGPEEMQKYTKLMQDGKNLDQLLNMIDQKSGEKQLATRG
jgi:hypothetical protein